jgi:hypothetical protein
MVYLESMAGSKIKIEEIISRLDQLHGATLRIGFFADVYHSGAAKSVASLAYDLARGTCTFPEAKYCPPRPILNFDVTQVHGTYKEDLIKAVTIYSDPETELSKMGEQFKMYIQGFRIRGSAGWAKPISEERKSARRLMGNYDITPLYDTGELCNSAEYRINTRGGKGFI